MRDPLGPDAAVEPVPANDPFVRRAAAAVAITATALVVLLVAWHGIEILLVGFGGVLFAVFLHALGEPLRRYTPLRGAWSLAVVLLVLLGGLGLGGWLLGAQLVEQALEVQQQLPAILAQFEAYLRDRPWGVWLLEQAQGAGDEGGADLPAQVGAFLGGISRWFGYLLTFFFVGLFAAASPRIYIDGIVRLVPLRSRGRAREVLDALGHTLRWWLIGRAIAMILVGISTAVLLLLLGAPFAPLLGLIACLFTFVPYLGPFAAGVPIALVTLLDGPQLALYAVGAYTVVQLVEGYVLDPVIQHRMVYLPPVLTLLAQMLLGVLLGVLGIALATPLAAVAAVLTRKLYIEDVLGDRPEQEADAAPRPWRRAAPASAAAQK